MQLSLGKNDVKLSYNGGGGDGKILVRYEILWTSSKT